MSIPNKLQFFIPDYGKMSEADLIKRNVIIAQRIETEDIGTISVGRTASDEEVLMFHTETYINALRTGFPPELASTGAIWTPDVYHFTKQRVGSFLDAIDQALISGVSGMMGLGGHHACPDCGGALSVLNDIGIGVHYIRHKLKKIFVLDLDMHFGNGTTAGFNNDPDLFLFDYHGLASNFFHPNTPHLFRDLTEDPYGTFYLDMLRKELPVSLDGFKPDFCIYLSGMDVYAGSANAKLLLNVRDIEVRENFVLSQIVIRRIPVVYAHGGAYLSEDSAANLHLITARAAADAISLKNSKTIIYRNEIS